METEECPQPSVTEVIQPGTSTTPPILRLRLQKKKNDKKVVWSEGTVDNEHLNRKKSKCCCIYKKPLAFGESSSEEEEECEHCFGHPEKKVKAHSHGQHPPSEPNNTPDEQEADDKSDHQCDSGSCTFKKQNDDNSHGVTE